MRVSPELEHECSDVEAGMSTSGSRASLNDPEAPPQPQLQPARKQTMSQPQLPPSNVGGK